MATNTLANRYRPRRFVEVVGQEGELAVIRQIVEKNWRPNAIMLTGPFGTGKTTLSRLIARVLLCDKREGVEPCGQCESCHSLDLDSHPNYLEVDAASHGLIGDVRAMKENIAYRSIGDKTRIVCYDESHMLSTPAQNALLATLEEGQKGVLFVFATTDPIKMLPTIRSRCVELKMKLLTANQIAERIKQVCSTEKIVLEDRAAKLIGSYVRGHVRDAMVLLEQLHQTAGEVTETAARTYLRLDRYDDVYQLLTTTDRKAGMEKLEALLCNFSPAELAELTGEVLVNAHKLKLGIDNQTQVDNAWLQKVLEARGDAILDQAEAILALNTDIATITYGIAVFANILFEDKARTRGPKNGLTTAPPSTGAIPTMPTRKPGK